MSTIRGLLVLGMYMAGRGFDGPCQIFVGLALKLSEGEWYSISVKVRDRGR